MAIYSPSCSRRRHFWSLQAEKTKCIHNSTACFVFVGLALACWLLSMLAKRSMPREKFGSSSLVSSIDYRKVQQQELAAKLVGNFAAKCNCTRYVIYARPCVYRDLLFNKLSLYPYMVRKPSISVILHDRYPAIYVNDHIWKCTADFLSLLVGGHFEKRSSFSSVLRKF